VSFIGYDYALPFPLEHLQDLAVADVALVITTGAVFTECKPRHRQAGDRPVTVRPWQIDCQTAHNFCGSKTTGTPAHCHKKAAPRSYETEAQAMTDGNKYRVRLDAIA
jgi:hypothetical protein